MRLSDFAALSFDCYGTLIDWETGILAALQPLLRRTALTLSPDVVLQAFAVHEGRQQTATPGMRYDALLAQVHASLAEEWGVAPEAAESARFGASIGDWPAFP